jgi:hypothetical protein
MRLTALADLGQKIERATKVVERASAELIEVQDESFPFEDKWDAQ